MEEQTRAYLRGRFADYYEGAAVPEPPAAGDREWGFIPYAPGDTRMVRHRALLDMGELNDFLARKRPRHVYYSAARYESPDAGSMSGKGWRGADLVFDLDADHLPAVDPAGDPLAAMLESCKDALRKLLDLLEADFGLDGFDVVFSGGRGYHVHVRDGRFRGLGRAERREIVDYVLGEGVDFDSVVRTETVGGEAGRETPAEKRTLPTDGGWGARTHARVLALVDELLELDDEDALLRLQSFEGIGEGRATAILNAARANYDALADGNVDVHPAVLQLARTLCEQTVREERAPVDEPVTTDVNRLIRLPGSLHGGSGLRVTPVDRDDLESFDPFEDAVPEPFRGRETAVDVRDPGPTPFTVDGGTFTVQAGVEYVPEPVGLFLMARGRAEKGKEG